MSTKNTKKCTPGCGSNSGAPSNWCSTYPRARGFLLSLRCRSNKVLPGSPVPPPSPRAATKQVAPLTSETRKRLRDLERDIDRLKARIRQENRRHMIAKRTRSSRPVGEEREAGKAPVAAAARFPDGSFLHEMSTRIGKPWERLCMHVSLPTLAEDATSAAEVLERFTKMNIGDLCRCLMSLMPMAEVTGLKVDTSRSGTTGNPPPYYPDDGMQFLTESILFASVREFEDLALEGIRIQMCSTRRSNSNRRTGTGTTGTTPVAGTDLDVKKTGRSTDRSDWAVASTDLDAKRTSRSTDRSDWAVAGTDLDAKRTGRSTDRSEWVVLVALIQMRDPREDYGPVGELMIGLIEAQLGRNGELQFGVEGVHVAGLNLARSKIAGRDFLWSVSLGLSCGGSDGSPGIIRNPNLLFPPPALGKN